MTPSEHNHRHPARHTPGASQHPHHGHHHAAQGSGRRQWNALRRGVVGLIRRPLMRRMFWVATLAFAVVAVAIASL